LTRWLPRQGFHAVVRAIRLGTLIVVAMSNGANPTQAVAGIFDDLPVASSYWIFRFAMVVLHLFEAQVRFDR
jgi:hypothetical protein